MKNVSADDSISFIRAERRMITAKRILLEFLR